MWVQIVLIVAGGYSLFFQGIFGQGYTFGRSKRFAERIGIIPARIIASIIGAGLIVFGILAILNPELIQ